MCLDYAWQQLAIAVNISTSIFNPLNKHYILAFTLLSLMLILDFSYNGFMETCKTSFPKQLLHVGFHSFLPSLFFLVANAMTPHDPAQNTSGVYHDKCNNAGCQFRCTPESQEHTKGILYVLPTAFHRVIEVLPSSEIPIVLRGHVSDKRMSCRLLCALGLKSKKLWNHAVGIN